MGILDRLRKKEENSVKDTENTQIIADTLKKDEEEIDNEQTTVTTSTVNKKMVWTLLFVFLTGIAATLMFSSSDDENTTDKQKEIEVAKTEQRTSTSNNVDKIPDNYDSLAEHEKRNRGNANNLNVENSSNQRQIPANQGNRQNYYPQDTNEEPVRYSRPLPVLGQNAGIYPVQNVRPMPQNSNENKKEEKEDKNIWASAISFMSFNKTDNKSETATGNSSAQENQSEGSFSYMKMQQIDENTVMTGTVISATLLSGINSQIGGQVIAQINSDVYDSLTGYNLLIPSGSRIIGSYAGGAANGQSRVDIKWMSLIFPNGTSYNVENMFKLVDAQGYAGIEGDVDNHTGKQIGAGVLASAIGALGNIASGNNYSEYGWRNSGDLAAQGATTSLINTASEMFKKQMNIEPEITVNPGTTINIMAVNNIVF